MKKHIHDESEAEKLRMENDFLKMKLMLEQGAEFGGMGNEKDLPPNVENQFLNNIIAFEEQFALHKKIRVYDKLGQPTQFKPVKNIPANKIEEAWDKLNVFLQQHQVSLDVCSPNVSARELYRFVLEELSDYEMDDIDVPGMVHGFIYDEFHPDHEYENTNAAVDDCISLMLSKRPVEWMPHLAAGNLRLNDHYPISEEEFKNLVNQFKLLFEELRLKDIMNTRYSIDGNISQVSSSYELSGIINNVEHQFKGQWMVEFSFNEKLGYWYIMNVQVSGIKF